MGTARSLTTIALAGIAAALPLVANVAKADPVTTTLFKFEDDGRGDYPQSTLIFDDDGALYGTTAFGGAFGHGTVFKLSPPAPGQTRWKRTVLHHFRSGADGDQPLAGLVRDEAGVLYGTTDLGGGGDDPCAGGCGTAFSLAPQTDGTWAYKILQRLPGNFGGFHTSAQLVFDQEGNLYGTTRGGGDNGFGAVFRLASTGGKYRVIHSFVGNATDGAVPAAGVVFDKDGNLYGTTRLGGGLGAGHGTVFNLVPKNAEGTRWAESVLYKFEGGDDGWDPQAPVVIDQHGVLYGTTSIGGIGPCFNSCGTVFRLAPKTDGSWKETIIYRFKGGKDGYLPFAGLIVDGAGNLYGTTPSGGAAPVSAGIVFKLAPPAPGETRWKETVLHSFTGVQPDGSTPMAALTFDSGGALYGTTYYGGVGVGSVFKLVP
jgi:uncharacterized repeat protein (TIGR03803 family)